MVLNKFTIINSKIIQDFVSHTQTRKIIFWLRRQQKYFVHNFKIIFRSMFGFTQETSPSNAITVTNGSLTLAVTVPT